MAEDKSGTDEAAEADGCGCGSILVALLILLPMFALHCGPPREVASVLTGAWNSSEVRDQVAVFRDAMSAGDYGEVCAELADAARREFSGGRGEDCDSVMRVRGESS